MNKLKCLILTLLLVSVSCSKDSPGGSIVELPVKNIPDTSPLAGSSGAEQEDALAYSDYKLSCGDECNTKLGLIIFEDQSCTAYSISENEAFFSSTCFKESIEELNVKCQNEIIVRSHDNVSQCNEIVEYKRTTKNELVFKIRTSKNIFPDTGSFKDDNSEEAVNELSSSQKVLMYSLSLDKDTKSIIQNDKICRIITDTVYELRSLNLQSELFVSDCKDSKFLNEKYVVVGDRVLNVECLQQNICDTSQATRDEIILKKFNNDERYIRVKNKLFAKHVDQDRVIEGGHEFVNRKFVYLDRKIVCFKEELLKSFHMITPFFRYRISLFGEVLLPSDSSEFLNIKRRLYEKVVSVPFPRDLYKNDEDQISQFSIENGESLKPRIVSYFISHPLNKPVDRYEILYVMNYQYQTLRSSRLPSVDIVPIDRVIDGLLCE